MKAKLLVFLDAKKMPSENRTFRFVAVALLATVSSHSAVADVFVTVPNASSIKYQIMGNNVWLRNLNEFNPNALGCCYNYHIDTSTLGGKNTFAAMLSAAAQGKSFVFGLADGYVAGQVTLSGQW